MKIGRTAGTLGAISALTLGMGGLASPAQAAPVVTGGLVNITIVDAVDVTDVTVIAQLPIAVAANICGVSVNVLATDLRNGSADCDALTNNDQTATVGFVR